MKKTESIHRKSIFYILAAAVFWGCSGAFFKELSVYGFGTMQVVFIRTSVATVILGSWLLIKDREAFKVKWRDAWCFAGTGLFSLLLFNWCIYEAIELNGIAVSFVLLYTAPAFVAVLSALLFQEKLNLPRWCTLIIVLAGCALVSGIMGVTDVSMIGVAFGLGSGFGYALYSIFGRYALNRNYRPQTIAFYTFTLCAAGSAALSLITTGNDFQFPALNTNILLYSLLLGSAGCVFPYVLYTKGLANVTGAQASMTATLEPVVATAIGVFIYNETLSIWQGLGATLIIGSILLLSQTSKNDVNKGNHS